MTEQNLQTGLYSVKQHVSLLKRVLDERIVVWFDIDNTLYSASSMISQAMGNRIHSELLEPNTELSYYILA